MEENWEAVSRSDSHALGALSMYAALKVTWESKIHSHLALFSSRGLILCFKTNVS